MLAVGSAGLAVNKLDSQALMPRIRRREQRDRCDGDPDGLPRLIDVVSARAGRPAYV